MRALVINCSALHYNLGARKLTDWLCAQGYDVTYGDGDPGLFAYGYDLVCLSVIFSWQAPVARAIALRVRRQADVWCGGPGMFALAHWWKRETGLDCQRGLDDRFERQRGRYRMTFASRGCPVNCSFCLTPETLIQTAEGLKPIMDIQAGDFVLTHCGRYRPVMQVLTRAYDGIVHELHNGAISKLFPTVVTPEHPVWVRHVSYPAGGAHLTHFYWVEAGDLKPECSRYSRDVTAFPRTREEYRPDGGTMPGAGWFLCDKDAMALIGWYLAEGYVSRALSRGYHRVTFCLGHTDREMAYAREIIAAAKAHGLKAKAWHVQIGIRVSIENVKLARWLIGAFGTGASDKRLPLWLRRLPAALLTPMLEAWAKGDGWRQSKRGTDTWKITTVSPHLAIGLREIALKVGYLATINRHCQNRVIQGRTVNSKPAYTVIYHAPREKKRTIVSDTDFTYSRIGESVQRTYTGTVYNLEVEDDHSYCTSSFAVHNCIVPRLEGRTFTLDGDFVPVITLCDNNLSALPVAFQEHILRRYHETETPLCDANSGFEPKTFDEETYRRWKPTLRGPWRFAFDTLSEEAEVGRMMRILHKESPKRKQVYVLIGNEPIAACHHRAQQVIAWGGEPFCQPFIALNALRRIPKVAYDWTPRLLRDFAPYFNRHVWRTVSLHEYRPRHAQPPPFAAVLVRERSRAIIPS